MKKIVTLAFMFLFFLGANAQIQFVGGDTVIYSGMTDASSTMVALGYIKNTGTTTATIAWELIDSSSQPSWQYTGFCDPNLCYSFYLNRKVQFHLAADTAEPMKLDLLANCVPGTGHVTCRLWNVADSANTAFNVVFAFNLTQSPACTNGINDIKATQISFYPNPVRSELKVSLPQTIAGGQIDVYDLIGSKVFSQPITTTSGVDLSTLESGIYIARISDNGKLIATKKFTKVN